MPMRGSWRSRSTSMMLFPLVAGVLAAPAQVSAQTPRPITTAAVTFTKDVAPILQRSCQNCHRPGSMAPMSLLSYDDVRP
jgi:hypothetical protein